ncbi:MAG: MraY family glycosyltransferase [Gaiellaceae bacterium]
MTSIPTMALAAAFAALLCGAFLRLPGPTALPKPDRWHSQPTPAAGGIALFAAFLLALQPGVLHAAVHRTYLPVVLGAAAAFALGLWDDSRPLSPQVKLIGQIVIAVGAAAGGLRPDWISTWAGIPLAAAALLAAMNGFNLLDNIDGLAAGTALIASTGLAVLAGLVPGSGSSVVAGALAGACLGFLPFNYRPGRPAALFMGDSGSHLLGFVLGGLALLASPGGAGGVAAAIAAPLLILSLPILDTSLVAVSRLGRAQPVWKGGLDHSSHRLVDRGLSEWRAVALLLGVAAFSTTTALLVVIVDRPVATAVSGALVFVGLILLAALLFKFRGPTRGELGMGQKSKT